MLYNDAKGDEIMRDHRAITLKAVICIVLTVCMLIIPLSIIPVSAEEADLADTGYSYGVERSYNYTIAVGSSTTLYGLCTGDYFSYADISCSGSCISYQTSGNGARITAKRVGEATLYIKTVSYSYGMYTEMFVDTAIYHITVAEKKNLSVPKITSLANAKTGVKVTWSKVKGTERYKVIRYFGSSYSSVAVTSANTWTDTNVSSGKKYSYAVKCCDSTGAIDWSSNSSFKAITYVACPKITKFQNSLKGTVISWNACSGAAKYRVFVRTSSGWKKLADTKSTGYTHTAAKVNRKYCYTVRCMNTKKKFNSAFNSSGWNHTYKKPIPKVTAADNTLTGVNIKWGKILGAVKYRVFYKVDGSSWKEMADTTATSYRFTKAVSGKKYTYTVRCVDSAGKKFTSDFNRTGFTAQYIKAPTGITLSCARNTNSITVSWSRSPGAVKYRVFRKINGSWQDIADTSALSYTDTSVSSSQSYSYTVRCISSSGKFTSAYNTTGATVYSPSWVTGVSLNKSNIAMAPGDTMNISATISPSNAFDKNLTWKTSNASVATVSYGRVTAKSTGYAVITATAHNGKSATVTVNVNKRITATELIGDMLIRTSSGEIYSLDNCTTRNTASGNGRAIIAHREYLPVTPATGEDHLVIRNGSYWAVDSRGYLYAWGSNPNGILGVGHTNYVSSPVKILTNVKAVYSSGRLCAAVTTSGDMYIWGYDLSSNVFYPDYIKSPTYKLSGVSKASAGFSHYGAIKTDKSFYMWGDNLDHQIRNTTTYTPEYTSPTLISSGVTDVELGAHSSTYINSSGKVAFVGTFESKDRTDTRTTGTVLSNVAVITSNNNRNFNAITTAGDLYSWGVCDGYSSGRVYSPNLISTNVKQAIPGEKSSMYLKKSNELYIWGAEYPVKIELYSGY